MQYLGPFTVLFNLICHFGDYIICKQTQRELPLNNFTWANFSTALCCQAALFAVRACSRSFLGLSPFMAFEMPDQVEAEEWFGPKRYGWIQEKIPHFALRTTFALSLVGSALMLVGRYFMVRAMNEGPRRRKDINR